MKKMTTVTAEVTAMVRFQIPGKTLPMDVMEKLVRKQVVRGLKAVTNPSRDDEGILGHWDHNIEITGVSEHGC